MRRVAFDRSVKDTMLGKVLLCFAGIPLKVAIEHVKGLSCFLRLLCSLSGRSAQVAA